jgi:hypothetical protein
MTEKNNSIVEVITDRLYVNVEIEGRRRVIKFLNVEEMKKFGEILIELATNINNE